MSEHNPFENMTLPELWYQYDLFEKHEGRIPKLLEKELDKHTKEIESKESFKAEKYAEQELGA